MRSRQEVNNEIYKILRQVKELHASGYQNCEPFRQRAGAIVDAQMHTFHEYGELHNYKIVCDDSNNTRIDEQCNDFNLQLMVQWEADADPVVYDINKFDTKQKRR